MLAGAAAALIAGVPALPAHADATDALRAFVRDTQSGRASFTQTVTSPDGAKKRTSSGQFEFARPGRFRFAYDKPYEQLIVADGQKVWTYDPELKQAVSRTQADALGATPAALLAGDGLERDFTLKPLPPADGLEWVQALPRASDGAFREVRVGFRGKALAAVDLIDSFGQRSTLRFDAMQVNPALAPERFRFTPPAGADVIAQ
jgi:outer membrane lipoprotein carrier protein